MTNRTDGGPPSSQEDVNQSPGDRKRDPQDRDHQFRALVEAVEEYAIFRLDLDGTVVSWNPGAERIKGYTEEEILGEHFSTFYTAADRSAGTPAENLAAAADHGSVEDEGWRVRADGSRFWANVTITAIRDSDGELEGYAKVTRDMTERREHEEQLREERDFTKQILNTAPASIFVINSAGDVEVANERLGKKLGMDDVTGEPSIDDLVLLDETEALIPPDERPYRLTFETGESVTDWQCRVELPSGNRRWVSFNVTPIADEDGAVEYAVVAARDITQLRRQAERLERQRDELENELAEIFDRVDEAFLTLGEDWRVTYVNNRAAELVRLSTEDLLGSHVRDVLPEVAEGYPREMVEEAMAGRESVDFECYSERLDIWVEVRGYPSENGVSVYFRDITERKEHERELRRALDLLEKTEHVADVGGWEIDVDTRDVFWTDHIFELLEVTADEEPPLDEAIDMYHEEDQPIVTAAVENALGSGAPFDVEVRIRTDSGEVRWLRLQGVPEIVDGEAVSLRGAAQDVTERKQREQRLEELIERLEESNKRLEQFAYAASHDLQEPLRMVSSYLQLIEQRYSNALDEDGADFLEFAIDGADRMRNMIEGLLKYSRVETQGDPFEPVDLDAVFEDVLDDLRVRIMESDAVITAEELPRVKGDAGQLRHVLQNLLKNAIEYGGDEPPRVQVSAERDGSEWIIAVSDEGIGIDPDYQEQIFEVFKRLHDSNDHSGTGIGLALCERIVERHGGRIWVESEPGEGSTFRFTIPRANQDDE